MTKAQAAFMTTVEPLPPMPDALPWRSGAYRDDAPPSSTPTPGATEPPTVGFDLEECEFTFTPKPRKPAPARPFAGVDSFARLAAKKAASGDMERFKANVRGLCDQTTQSLIGRITTTTDALTLWAIHCQLEKRDIAPAQRWPGNVGTDQMLFVSWCADMSWFAKHHPDHAPHFCKNWPQLLKLKPRSTEWLEKCFWLFAQTSTTAGCPVSFKTARALALTNDQRIDLLTCPTSAMVNARRELAPEKLEAIKDRLLRYAIAHPDKANKAGKYKSTDIASRRANLYLVHILSGSHATTTARNWQALTGKTLARQTVNDRINALENALRRTAHF